MVQKKNKRRTEEEQKKNKKNLADNRQIQLAHGGGGQLTARLVAEVILPAVGGQDAKSLYDAAVMDQQAGKLAFTTDSYVVQPLEFPGGDIGKLAVCGTINDLAVSGAVPRALSLSLVIQEGLEIELLRRLLRSAGRTAADAGVPIVTGDTKVVPRGACDGLIINTAGVGQVLPEAELGFGKVQEGDYVMLSGALGEHAMAVMTCRQNLGLTTELKSDCCWLHDLTAELISRLGREVRFLRDPTRGGLAATLVDLATAAGKDIEIREESIPVNRTARAAAEMLGLDLLNAANEGKLLAVVSAAAAKEAVAMLRRHEKAAKAAWIGAVGRPGDGDAGALVEMVTRVGGRRIVQMPYGEELPRIC